MNLQFFILINNARLSFLDFLSVTVSNFIFLLVLVILLLILVCIFDKKNRLYILLGVFSALVLEVISLEAILKPLIHTVRPYLALSGVHTLGSLLPNGSFPSGHVALISAILLIICFYEKRFRISAAVFILILGWSRIYNGLHWPIDILGGLIIGCLIGGLVVFEVERLRKSLKFGKKDR